MSAIGPGKYDHLLTTARTLAGATSAVLIIFDGNQGFGFSVQAPLHVQLQLPETLRQLAAGVASQLPQLTKEALNG